MFTAMVGAAVLLTVLGAVILKIVHPDFDTKSAGSFIAHIMNTIVGALVGFIGGRATGRMEVNGRIEQEKNNKQKEELT